MTDSYSFDMSDEGLDESYANHRAAYQRIFDRVGLKYEICKATSGAMGGSASEEFLAYSDNGEDTFVVSTAGDYAANVEAVTTVAPEARAVEGLPEAVEHDTPKSETIAALVEWAQSAGVLIDDRPAEASDTLKCMMIKVNDPRAVDEDGKPVGPQLVGVLIPGDRELDEKRLESSLEPATFELASDEDFAKNDFLVKGYVGPRALQANGVRVLADPRVVDGSAWITGADAPQKHVVGLVAGRDFTVDGYIEAAEIKEGDPSPSGNGTVKLARGIELGHIFQLGRKYTEAMDVQILDENGKRAVPTMGSYGIGISRMLAVVAEQRHDDKGLVWPVEIAPYQVHVAVANKDAAALEAGDRIAAELSDAGLEVLFDDRPKVSPGVKFKDAELLGMPFIVILGRAFADGNVELRIRGGETLEVPADDIVAKVQELVAERRG